MDGPEVSFPGLLIKVEANKRPAKVSGNGCASRSVDHQGNKQGRVDGEENACQRPGWEGQPGGTTALAAHRPAEQARKEESGHVPGVAWCKIGIGSFCDAREQPAWKGVLEFSCTGEGDQVHSRAKQSQRKFQAGIAELGDVAADTLVGVVDQAFALQQRRSTAPNIGIPHRRTANSSERQQRGPRGACGLGSGRKQRLGPEAGLPCELIG